MRILMLSDFYPPVIGGLEFHVQTLSRELVRRGHEVAIAILAHEGSPDFDVDAGVRIYRITGWNHRLLRPFYVSSERQFHPPIPDPGTMSGLRKVMEKERPDIVHGHSWILYSYLPLRPKYQAKLVATLHDYGLVCPKKNYMRGSKLCDGPAFAKCVPCAATQYGPAKSLLLCGGVEVSKRLRGRVDRYVAVSHMVKAATSQVAGWPQRPFDVIPTVVSDSVFDDSGALGRPAFLPAEDGYILFAGEFAHHKGVQALLKAYKDIADLAPLVLIGAEHGTSPFEFPDGVTVARNVAYADVMAAWEHCSICVVPSIWPDPSPHVAIEAMARGKPVVASAVGGLPEIVRDNETGLLVPPGDAPALSAALRELLLDPARRAQMGALGRQWAQQFSARAVGDRIEQLYADVLHPGLPQSER
jgi:glycosyltransferase involved in cell wall biosynthesis